MPWFPHDKFLWDFWFACKDKELHLFYLQANQADCSYDHNRRHNLAGVGHAVLTDYGWKELSTEKAVFRRSEESGAWDDLAIWTGSIIQHPENHLYYMFYTGRCHNDPIYWTPQERQRPQNIGLAVSSDLTNWKRLQSEPTIRNPGVESGFDGIAWRDPYVVQGEDGKFYAFICARHTESLGGAGGVVAYLTSDNLEQWQESPQILVASPDFYQMEVPQVFWRRVGDRKRLYLIFCARTEDCSRERYERMPVDQCHTGTYYMYSDLVPIDSQELPPLQKPATLLAANLYAGKLLNPETETNPIFFGFPWEDSAGRFVGGLSDPQRVEFHPDGPIEFCE